MNQIKLGNTVRDVISGFSGIAIQKTEYLNGNVQYSLQPKGKEDGVFLDAMSIDYHTLDVVDDGVADRASVPVETDHILLGQLVKDRASDFTGIATMKATYINGCVSFGVVPKSRPGTTLFDDAPKASFVDAGRLIVVGDGLIADEPRTAEIKNDRPVGGPAVRQSRSRNIG